LSAYNKNQNAELGELKSVNSKSETTEKSQKSHLFYGLVID
jgi:hypothetical protein